MEKRGTPDSGVEQAVSRALRDNLAKLQTTADELHQAVADLVAACASSRPTNSLPPMLRAQTAAASLAASLEVLSRFVTTAMQAAPQTSAEKETVLAFGPAAPEPPRDQAPLAPSLPTPMAAAPASIEIGPAADMIGEGAPVASPEPVLAEPDLTNVSFTDFETAAVATEPPAPQPTSFELAGLSPADLEMHRRANRVAKVAMQDIKMLRPEKVRQGRAKKDLCQRLSNEIEKARREYDRRFGPILGHPVDYFYHWMVEILADGDHEALGEYPYPSPLLQR